MPNNLMKALFYKVFPNRKRTTNSFEENKIINAFSISIKHNLKNAILITIGIFCAGFGLESFLLPNSFIDGGATGVALLISEVFRFPLSILIVAINIPFILLGIKVINKTFAFKAALAISGLAIVIATIHFPIITSDKLLISIFGGFFLGAGIGFTIRGGAVLDGSEILAIFLARKFNISVGDFILIINFIVFSVAAYLLSIETAMYAMLTYISASKTVDFLIEGIEEYFGITIISEFSDEIQTMIKQEMKRGYTVYAQKKGTGKKGERNIESEIIYTVITRLEIGKLYSEIEKIDSDAFIIKQSVKDIKGGMVKKRPLDAH